MRRASLIATIMLLPAVLAACGPGNKQGTGTIVGAIAGGAAGAGIGGNGSRGVAGAAIGAVAGGILGNEIGRQMDERDRQIAAAAEYQALEYGQPGAPKVSASSCRELEPGAQAPLRRGLELEASLIEMREIGNDREPKA